MKDLINRLKPVLCLGLFFVMYHSIGTAQAIDVIDPVRVMAAQCSQCHGMEGNSSEGFDNLSGESAREIFDELSEMLDSSNPELMDHQARGYTQAQIRDLANYFAGQPKTSGGEDEEDEEDEEEDEDEEDEEDEEEDD